MSVMVILAGTFIAAGCTPDGACWPDFTTSRDAYVWTVPETALEGRRGVCFCGAGGAYIKIAPDASYPFKLVLAHELGHDAGVTVHKNGNIYDWRD